MQIGCAIHEIMQPHNSASPHEAAIQTLVPTKNKFALIAYYLGVFGFIPLLGLPLSVAAIILGRKGLREYQANPTPGAKGHAIAGIVMGIIQITVFVVFLVLMAIARNTKA